MGKQKNFNTGTRRDIIYLLHCVGILTYRSIRILPQTQFNKRTMQQKINEMIGEGCLIRRKPVVNSIKESFIRMQNYETNRKIFTVNIPIECVDTYVSYFKEDIRSLSNLKSSKPLRKIMESEIITLMYSAGIDAMPDQVTGTSKFYIAREIKRYSGYEDEVVQVDGKRKVQFSKVIGLLISDGGNYATYHTYKNGLGNLSGGEYKIKYQLANIAKKIQERDTKVESALVVVSELERLIPFIDINDLNSKYASQYYNFTNAYQSIYCIPYNEYGRDMIKLMTKASWKTDIIKSAMGEVQDTTYVNYICDYYDSETGTGTLIYCIPDIIRLKKFLEAAKLKEDKSKYHIICFDYQKKFIKEIAGKYTQIYTTSFYSYYEGDKPK